MIFILNTSVSRGNFAKNTNALPTLSTLIIGSTLLLPSACHVPFCEWEAKSVAAFPMSICVQTIPCFLPSRDVDLVKPRIACLEMVYEAESSR